MSIDYRVLHTAICNRRQVRIEYTEADGTPWKFTLEPYTLFYDSDRFTLYGHTWGSYPVAYQTGCRNFLFDRITSAEIMAATFERPQEAYFERNWKPFRVVADVYFPPLMG